MSFAIQDGAVLRYRGSKASVTLPDDLHTVGAQAFWRCLRLEAAALPHVQRIGAQAFEFCFALKTVDFSPALQRIEAYAFRGCGLQEIRLPDGLTFIGEGAFWGCRGLRRVRIPAGVQHIGPGAFAMCQGLEAIEVDPANQRYRSVDGALYSKDVLCCWPALKEGPVRLPAAVQTIGSRAFSGSAVLETICLPQGIRTMESGAFEYCEQLKQLTLPEGLRFIGTDAIYGCDRLHQLALPQTLECLDFRALANSGLERAVLPEGLRELGSGAFAGCSRLTEVVIPDSVPQVGMQLFRGLDPNAPIRIVNELGQDRNLQYRSRGWR